MPAIAVRHVLGLVYDPVQRRYTAHRPLEGMYSRASERSRERELGLVVQMLIAANSDVNVSDSLLQETPLMEAASAGDCNLCKALLKARADPGRTNPAGLKAVDFADHNNKEAAELLNLFTLTGRFPDDNANAGVFNTSYSYLGDPSPPPKPRDIGRVVYMNSKSRQGWPMGRWGAV